MLERESLREQTLDPGFIRLLKQASLGASPESTRAAPLVTHRDESGAAQEPQAEQEMQEPELSQEEKAAERASVDTDIVHCIIEVQGLLAHYSDADVAATRGQCLMSIAPAPLPFACHWQKL